MYAPTADEDVTPRNDTTKTRRYDSVADSEKMCYYQLKLYMLCGHGEQSKGPLKNGPPCPVNAKEQCRTPAAGSPTTPISPTKSVRTKGDSQKENRDPDQRREITCTVKNAHPLHTYRVESLCPACNQERWQRLAKFEVGAIDEGVTRGFIKDRQRDRVEFHGKKLRTLRTGYEAGKRNSEALTEAEETILRDVQSVMSLDGDTLQEARTPEKENVTASGRNSLVDASKLRRRSTLKSKVEVAGPARAVEVERQPSVSMVTRVQSLFNT